MMEAESQSQPLMELEPPTLRNGDRPRHRPRRRRRSSARFLRLTGRLMEDIDEEGEEEEEEKFESEQHLGDMYKRAIRMNAENRINASNSWNLHLIENIDKFLEEEPEDSQSPDSSRSPSPVRDENTDPADDSSTAPPKGKVCKEKRVNFTKASCTLDASVKIYSYRVDDVHLTSYKVLANLNRTDNNETARKKSKQSKDSGASQANTGDVPGTEEEDDDEPSNRRTKNAATLETNVANINMNKLDSAFDIDPLFHKMSKTFDEGGAKGLLLVNLGVGDKGCNIVFDSKAEFDEEEASIDNAKEDANEARENGMVDISSLLTKLDATIGQQALESLSLVPQLASLREQYAVLKEEGYVNEKVRSTMRYASTQAEENEADMSIHQEAIERSRASQANLGKSFASQDGGGFGDDDDDNDGGAMPFGSGDFAGDNDDDTGFENFLGINNDGARISSISFRDSFASALGAREEKSQADILLDAICAGNVIDGTGEYGYFDTKVLETSVAGNLWAGSAHWKRAEPRKKQQNKAKAKPTKRTKKNKKQKSITFIDLTTKPSLEDILRKPPKGKRGANPLQFTKKTITNYTNEENLLPLDSGVGLDKLTGLFLRPNIRVEQIVSEPAQQKPNKSVCFDAAVETFGAAFDDSFVGDDDGPGFAFADDGDDDNIGDMSEDNFVLEELKGVRKVDTKNVQVGYATVAKKVDVRRLKRELWSGLECTLISKPDEAEVPTDEEDSIMSAKKSATLAGGISFQDTVSDMEQGKTQADVTLPFYFICILHLANEKGLQLESTGLKDFVIRSDQNVVTPSV